MADRLILMDSARGADCAALRAALVRVLGPAATGYAGLAAGDDFSAAVKAALARWQAEAGLVADGICGPCCQHELGLRALPDLEQPLEVRTVRRLFPATQPSGIVRHLPYLAAALAAFSGRPAIGPARPGCPPGGVRGVRAHGRGACARQHPARPGPVQRL